MINSEKHTTDWQSETHIFQNFREWLGKGN